jgi:hypothetical protein
MRILIVDQCSSAKKTSDRNDPLDKDAIDTTPLEELVSRDGVESYRAEELYQGRQQQRITEAKKLLEQAGDDVDRVFISAGFGLVDGSQELPIYNVTFNDAGASEIDDRSEKLGIQEDLRELISGDSYDVIFFALGSDYYRSAKLNEILPDVPETTSVVVFNREDLAGEYKNVLSIPARTSQAKTYGTIVVALKGEYLRNFASQRTAGEDIEDIDDIKHFCEQQSGSQAGLDDYPSSNP